MKFEFSLNTHFFGDRLLSREMREVLAAVDREEPSKFRTVPSSDIAASGSSCGKRSAKAGSAGGFLPSARVSTASRWRSEAGARRR